MQNGKIKNTCKPYSLYNWLTGVPGSVSEQYVLGVFRYGDGGTDKETCDCCCDRIEELVNDVTDGNAFVKQFLAPGESLLFLLFVLIEFDVPVLLEADERSNSEAGGKTLDD